MLSRHYNAPEWIWRPQSRRRAHVDLFSASLAQSHELRSHQSSDLQVFLFLVFHRGLDCGMIQVRGKNFDKIVNISS